MSPVILEYKGIGLNQMEGKELLNRFDTKFLMPRDSLSEILNEAKENYDILEINGKRLLAYHSRYFDTSDYRMYHHHHNGKQNRYKIRIRTYEDTEEVFAEVKFKNNKGKVFKKRHQLIDKNDSTKEIKQFINEHSPYDPELLEEKLQVRYQRITLIHKKINERITLDFNLCFSSEFGIKKIPSAVIVEVKQKRPFADSDFISILKLRNFHSVNFSKYCIGAALLEDNLKKNNFKFRISELANYQY